MMRKSTLALLVVLGAIAMLNSLAMATTTTFGNMVRFSATADTFVTHGTQPIDHVVFTPTASGKVYKLRKDSLTGFVVWETTSTATTKVDENLPIQVPNGTTLYWQTDDSSGSFQGGSIYFRPDSTNPQ